jgi:tRNA/rRNA methyltransferase
MPIREFHKPIIILENPKYAGNVGMICRLIGNFGLDPLRICQKQEAKGIEIEWMAYEAKEEIAKIQRFSTIEECLDDVEILIGTSMFAESGGKKRASIQDIPNLIEGKKYALLFGREDNGLSRKTKELCDFLVDFQVPGYQKSMNLSHSVAYFLSFLYNSLENPIRKVEPLQRDKQKLYKKAKNVFEILGMNEFHQNEHLATKRFQNIVERANPTNGDVDFLFKFFREIERLNNTNKKNDSEDN